MAAVSSVQYFAYMLFALIVWGMAIGWLCEAYGSYDPMENLAEKSVITLLTFAALWISGWPHWLAVLTIPAAIGGTVAYRIFNGANFKSGFHFDFLFLTVGTALGMGVIALTFGLSIVSVISGLLPPVVMVRFIKNSADLKDMPSTTFVKRMMIDGVFGLVLLHLPIFIFLTQIW